MHENALNSLKLLLLQINDEILLMILSGCRFFMFETIAKAV